MKIEEKLDQELAELGTVDHPKSTRNKKSRYKEFKAVHKHLENVKQRRYILGTSFYL